jgi:hypothetical protein
LEVYRHFLTLTTVVMKDILVSHRLWLDKNMELKYVKIINRTNEGKRQRSPNNMPLQAQRKSRSTTLPMINLGEGVR